MMSQVFLFVSGLFFSLPFVNCLYARPQLTEAEQIEAIGKLMANEFQLITPENIKTELSATYSLDVSPTIITNDEFVMVTYQTATPTKYDWIGAYSPSTVDPTTTVPVKYAYCDHHNPTYNVTGTGTLSFNLTNLRADVAFYYFSNGLKYPVRKAMSPNNVTFYNFNQPLRPRVVATGDPDIFNLLWSSATSTEPVLKWGLTPGEYTHTVAATTSTIEKSQMCGAPANTIGWRDLGLIHTAPFVGMVENANLDIYYTFGDLTDGIFSDEFVLHVHPVAGTNPPNRPTSVILFDDLGRGCNDDAYTWNEYGKPSYLTTLSASALINQGLIDGVYHGGDISYATGYEAVWDFFLDEISPMSRGAVYLTTVGNHESDWPGTDTTVGNTDSGGECGVSATVLIPPPGPATTNQPWWSYDIGLIHFIGMSTEHNYSFYSPQYNWLENDLRGVDRSKTPWVIFGGHRAMYLNSNYGGNPSSDIYVMNEMIRYLEPLLFKYRVNLAFYGHNHVVQRQSAVYNRTVIQASREAKNSQGETVHIHDDPQATVHLVVGTGGATFTVNYVSPYPVWNEEVFYLYGYSVVEAVNASYLTWRWIHAVDDEVIDRMVITQGDPTQPWVLPQDDTSSSSSSSASSALSPTATALVVVGVVLAFGVVGGAYFYFRSKSKSSSLLEEDEQYQTLKGDNAQGLAQKI